MPDFVWGGRGFGVWGGLGGCWRPIVPLYPYLTLSITANLGGGVARLEQPFHSIDPFLYHKPHVKNLWRSASHISRGDHTLQSQKTVLGFDRGRFGAAVFGCASQASQGQSGISAHHLRKPTGSICKTTQDKGCLPGPDTVDGRNPAPP